jgi:hypothetical protein
MFEDEESQSSKKISTNSKLSKEARQLAISNTPKATHNGVIDIAGVTINCHVLEDKRRVLSTNGIMKAIGRRWRGRAHSGIKLPVFLEANNLKPFISENLEKVLTPIILIRKLEGKVRGSIMRFCYLYVIFI